VASDDTLTSDTEGNEIIEATTNCDFCGKKVTISVPSKDLLEATRIPMSFLDVHGKPSHALLVYLDRAGKIRGQEYVEKLALDADLVNSIFSSLVPAGGTDPSKQSISIIRLVFQATEYLFKALSLESGDLLRKLGVELGHFIHKQFPRNSVGEGLLFLQQYWTENALGRMEVTRPTFPLSFRVFDCFECSNVPNIGRCFCSFDEGIIEGYFSDVTAQDVHAKEEKCPAKGDPYCEFVVDMLQKPGNLRGGKKSHVELFDS
jgi:predicted hydrocarbon binding protein